MNVGYFLSFTVFLTLSSPEFASRFVYGTPQERGLLTLPQYLRFWAAVYRS
jgi:hypothetical protein